ncbi:hypothetical protein ACET3Z_032978 [Daucus carota]
MKIKFYGFCWDAVENDFKVVVSYYKLGNLDSLSIYSCKLGSWSSPFNSLFTEVWSDGHRLPCAIVSGVPYWTYSWYSRGTVKLFKFDVVSKDFKKVPELYLFDENKFIVVNLKECLSALVYDYAQSISSLVDVHCFDEGLGVWSKMYSVGPINGDLFCRGWSNMHNVRVITGELLGCFKHGGEIVFSANSSWSSPRNSLFNEVWCVGRGLPIAIVSGVPYWTYCRGTLKLFKFDVISKDFRELPELHLFDSKKDVSVVNLKECLSALVYDYVQSINSLVDVHCFDKGLGVWSKMYSVGPINGDMFSCGWSDMQNVRVTGKLLGCFKHGGEIVFSANSKYRCYDHKTDEIRNLRSQEGYTHKCFSYKASLIFLKGMKPQHQVEPTLWK